MTQQHPLAVLVLLLFVFVAGCATSPTGRSQFLMNSEVEMAQMGQAAFADMQSKTARSVNTSQTAYVRCVAGAITAVLTPEELRPVSVSRWEIELFEDSSANAFA